MERAEIMAWRRERRAALIEARRTMSVTAYNAASASITKSLAELLVAERGKCVGFYWPFRREYNAVPAIERHIEAGGSAALPVVVGKKQPLEFRPWHKGVRMDTGVYDIPFPADGPPVRPDVLVVALVGFDERCYRLGYGGGFYDITLAQEPRPRTIAVGFELGAMETIYPLGHDIPMDVVVTEARVRRASLVAPPP